MPGSTGPKTLEEAVDGHRRVLSDYGARGYYAGAVKGVIVSIARDVQVLDITHDLDPYDVPAGAFVLQQCWSWYSPGTAFLRLSTPGRIGEEDN